jgi:hypothetical protein
MAMASRSLPERILAANVDGIGRDAVEHRRDDAVRQR